MTITRAGRRLVAFFVALPNLGWSVGPVVINEIHYHPPSPGSKTLEFVEVANTSAQEVSLAGWSLDGAVEFLFPASARLPAGGFAVVGRDRTELSREFGLPSAGVFGNFTGALDNDSDEVRLLDASRAIADAVRYFDDAPWPTGADGTGASLERICPSSPSHQNDNWSSLPGARPTPLARNAGLVCPPPSFAPPAVVINEIHYHTGDDPESGADRDHLEEYVEILNAGSVEVDLSGWTLGEGIEFAFPNGQRLAAGAHLVVCRNQDYVRGVLGVQNAIGDFTGELANGGEAIVLLDGTRNLVDGVHYRDSGEWPYAADGFGRSLERISPALRGDDPANWASSVLGRSGFSHKSVVGKLGNLFTQRAIVGVNGAGEFFIDNILLARVEDPGTNILPNGDFEAGLAPWETGTGNAMTSAVEPGTGVGGSNGLHLISTGGCDTGCFCGRLNSVSYSFPVGTLDPNADYIFAFDFRYVSGLPNLYARVLGGAAVCLETSLGTPGIANLTARPEPPPHIAGISRFPQEPRSSDRVSVTAGVRSAGSSPVTLVELVYNVGPTQASLAMADDGLHGDGFAGDGVWGAEVPPFPHDSVVLFRINARSADGQVGSSPHVRDDGEIKPNEYWGFYVNDNQPSSELPVYHVVLPEVNATIPQAINGFLNCSQLKPGTFAFRGEAYPSVGMRLRGNTACFLEKTNLKLRFNRERPFRGVRKLNLQGIWTDKALVREYLAWNFVGEIGAPYCETEFIRVHLNGLYHGLFLYLEHPDEIFLERNGLNPDGCLYKAGQPRGPDFPIGVALQSNCDRYAQVWEEETCKDKSFDDLCEFVGSLHADGTRAGGPTAEFHLTRVFPEQLIGYQLAQSVLNNIDSFAKNHFMYRDTSNDTWGHITWDMDLVFGKNFDPDVRPVGTLNDCMLSPGRDLNPWFGATVNGNPLYHHFVNFFFTAGRDFFQRAYLVRLWDILQEKYTNEVYDPILDELEAFLAQEQADDFARWRRSPVNCLPDCTTICANRLDLRYNLGIVKEQLRLHRQFLTRYVQQFHSSVINHDRMKITEILYNSFGPADDLEFIEIQNTSGRAIDITGWKLDEGVEFTFPPESVIAADEVILVVRSRDAFLRAHPQLSESQKVFGNFIGNLQNGGERLRLVDRGPGYPATIDFVEYRDGGLWPDTREGHSIELTRVSPLRDNDRPESWAQSVLLGGTPGFVGRVFVRGDTDGDLALSLSDPVRALLFLFQGAALNLCGDAIDADDDGATTLSDPIYVLNYLFRGGPAPAAPFPQAGVDLTQDTLVCP
jgi:hypothetical protein